MAATALRSVRNALPRRALLANISKQTYTPLSAISKRSFADKKTGDLGADKMHTTDKTGGHKDVQSEASDAGQKDRAAGGPTSQATSQSDHGKSNAKAKGDHPEAPEPVIGMNDERGTKGR